MSENNIIIYNTADGKASVSLLTKDGKAWLSQSQLAELFATSIPNISMHISNIFEEGELDKNSVVKDYLTTANDGKNYSVSHYALAMILAIEREQVEQKLQSFKELEEDIKRLH